MKRLWTITATLGSLRLHFGWRRNMGLVCLSWEIPKGSHERLCCLHLLIRPDPRDSMPRRWLWGKTEYWYDGPFHEWGAGPLFRFCWTDR